MANELDWALGEDWVAPWDEPAQNTATAVSPAVKPIVSPITPYQSTPSIVNKEYTGQGVRNVIGGIVQGVSEGVDWLMNAEKKQQETVSQVIKKNATVTPPPKVVEQIENLPSNQTLGSVVKGNQALSGIYQGGLTYARRLASGEVRYKNPQNLSQVMEDITAPMYSASETKPAQELLPKTGKKTAAESYQKWEDANFIEAMATWLIAPDITMMVPGGKGAKVVSKIEGRLLLKLKDMIEEGAEKGALAKILLKAGIKEAEVPNIIKLATSKSKDSIIKEAFGDVKGFTVSRGGTPASPDYSFMHGFLDKAKTLFITDTDVPVPLKGKGIATDMLAEIKKMSGAKKVVAVNMTPEGVGFWKKMGVDVGDMAKYQKDIVPYREWYIADYLNKPAPKVLHSLKDTFFNKRVTPEMRSNFDKWVAVLPEDIKLDIKRIIVPEGMITRYGEPMKGYSAQWIESERMMKLHKIHTAEDFFHEIAHSIGIDDEKGAEDFAQKMGKKLKDAQSKGITLTSGIFPSATPKYVAPVGSVDVGHALLAGTSGDGKRHIVSPRGVDAIVKDLEKIQLKLPKNERLAKVMLPFINIATKSKTVKFNPETILSAIAEEIDMWSSHATQMVTRPIESLYKKVGDAGIDVTEQFVNHADVVAHADAPKMKLPSGAEVPSMHINDIIEFADRYDMPPVMREWVDEVRRISAECTAMCEMEAKKLDIPFKKARDESDWRYFKRIVTAIGEEDRVSYAYWKDMTRPRKYNYAAEGALDTMEYANPMAATINMVEDAYDFVGWLRMKEKLYEWTTTAASRVDPILTEKVADGERWVAKLSKITGTAGWGSLVTRAMRGEQLAGASLKMIRSVDKDLFDKLQVLRQKYGSLKPDEANKILNRLATEISKRTKVTRTELERLVINERGGTKISVANPLTKGEITRALDKLNVNNANTTKTLNQLYSSVISSRRMTRDVQKEFNAIKAEFLDLEKKARAKLEVDKKNYQQALAYAGKSEIKKEGTAQLAGTRIFTTQNIYGKEYTGAQLAKLINKEFVKQHGIAERFIGKSGKIWRTIVSAKAAIDLSQQGIQTLLISGYDFWKVARMIPDAYFTGIPTNGQLTWTKGALKNFQYALNPEKAKAILEDPDIVAIMAEMAFHQGGLASMGSEFTAEIHALRNAKLPQWMAKSMPWLQNAATKSYDPTLGMLYERLGDAFTFSRMYAQVKWYMAERPRAIAGLTDPAKISERLTELARLSNDISGTTGKSGLPSWQRAVEGFLFFAPRLNRSVFSMIANLVSNKPYTRKVAWESLTGLIGSAYLTYTIAALAMGQKPCLNPLPKSAGGDGANFLTVDIGGTRIGIGGTVQGLIRLAGDNYDHLANGDGGAVLNPFDPDNPNIRYLRGKLHPASGFVVDVVSGEDYMGNLTRDNAGSFFASAGKLITPIWLQGMIDSSMKGASWQASAVAGFGDFFGGRTIPESDWTRYDTMRNVYAAQDYSKKYKSPLYKNLNREDADNLLRNHPDLQELKLKADASMATVTQGIPKFVKEKSDELKKAEADGLEKAATAYYSGDISAKLFDSELKNARVWYSSGMKVLYAMRETLDPQTQKAIEKWIKLNQTPEDEAYSKYAELSNKLYEESELPRDYADIERQLNDFASQYPPHYKDYFIRMQKNWIQDLPPTAKKLMEEREIRIANGSWWKGYSGGTKSSGFKSKFGTGTSGTTQQKTSGFKSKF